MPRRSSPCLPLFFSPEYRLSRLSFRFASFFFPIILLRSELRAIYPTPSSSSPARSFAIRRCERAIEKRREEKERPIGFNEGNLVSAQVGDRAGEFIFSEARRARFGIVSVVPPTPVGHPNKFHSVSSARTRVRESFPSSPSRPLSSIASRMRRTHRARGWQLNGLTTFRLICSAEQCNSLLGPDLIGRQESRPVRRDRARSRENRSALTVLG